MASIQETQEMILEPVPSNQRSRLNHRFIPKRCANDASIFILIDALGLGDIMVTSGHIRTISWSSKVAVRSPEPLISAVVPPALTASDATCVKTLMFRHEVW